MLLTKDDKAYYGYCAQNNYLRIELGDSVNLVSCVIAMKGDEDTVFVVIKESTVFAVIPRAPGLASASHRLQSVYDEYGGDPQLTRLNHARHRHQQQMLP